MEDDIPVADSEEKRAEDTEIDPKEEALVKKWTDIIAQMEARHKKHFEMIDENRKSVRGEGESHDQGTVRVNVAHAHIKRAVNRAYARNPEFSIRPTPFINTASVPMWRMFGQTAEIVLNRALKAADFKRRAKSCLRAAKTSRIGWLKVRWQQEVKTDGEVKNKINDTRTMLNHLRALEDKIETIEDQDRQDAIVAEHEELLETLESQEKFVALQGLVLDSVSPKNMLVPFEGCENFDEYVNLPYMAERVWKTKTDAEDEYGTMVDGTEYFKSKSEDFTTDALSKAKKGTMGEDGDFVLLYEIWDRINGRVKILPHGGKRFLANFIPKKLGVRWYPYFALPQNPIDGQFFPHSDVELMRELGDEINNSLTKLRDHRSLCVPHWIADSTVVKKKSIDAYKHGTLGEIVLIEGQQGKRMSEIFEAAKHPVIDPQVYSTAHLEQAIEKVVGGGDITNPKSNRSRTLGEANKLAQDVSVDVSADTEEMEDWFKDVGEYIIEILLQRLTIQDVELIAGPRMEEEVNPETGKPTGKLIDGAYWPVFSSEEIFNNVNFIVKPGSSGKPGKEQEAQVWTQFVMPKMMELLKAVAEMRQLGMEQEAQSAIFIAKETLRRVDPFFDINEFVPPPQPPSKEKQLEQAQAVEQRAKELELLNSQIAKEQAETARILSDKAVKDIELARVQSEMRLTDEQIESMNIDDNIKGIMAKIDVRLKQVEADFRKREIELKERELEIKRKEADNKAKQLAKTNEGGNNGQS